MHMAINNNLLGFTQLIHITVLIPNAHHQDVLRHTLYKRGSHLSQSYEGKGKFWHH